MTELRAAAAVVGAVLGIDFVTGRALSLFFAQLCGASWLGICASSAFFALMAALLSSLGRRCGAHSMQKLLDRLPCIHIRRLAGLLYGLTQLAAAGIALISAAHASALLLPLRSAALYGTGFALILALQIALVRSSVQARLSRCIVTLVAAFELALTLLAPTVKRFGVRFELVLKLADNLPAAAMLGGIYASQCLCVASDAILRATNGQTRPLRLGAAAGLTLGMLLALGNAALMRQPVQLLALRYPFAAAASGFGSAGHHVCAALMFVTAAHTLSALISALLRGKRC